MLTSAPDNLEVQTIKDWLMKQGLCGVSGSVALAKILNVSQRTICNCVKRGLKYMGNAGANSYSFRIEDVAEWLSQNPRYVTQRGRTWDISEETVNLIKQALKNWQPLLAQMEESDVVSMVLEELSRTRRSRAQCSESTVIHRAIGRIWNKAKREPLANAIRKEFE